MAGARGLNAELRHLRVTFGVFVASIAAVACEGGGATSSRNATYVATLTGAGERPAVASAAAGSAVFIRTGTDVSYRVTASGFSTALTVGHIHIGAAGFVGPVIVPFTIIAQTGTVATGSINLALPVTQGNITISGDSLRSLFDAGAAYVNLHTAAFPDGEIRGQIVRQ
jgi:hypothetical protein